MEMSTSDVGNVRGDNSKWFKIAVYLCLLLGVITTILIAVTLVQINKGFNDNKDALSEEKISSESEEDRIPRMYPGFFRTATEQCELAATLTLNKNFTVNTSIDIPEVRSHCVIGSGEPFNWTDVVFNNVNNGCCKSSNTNQEPNYMKDISGKLRKIAQFNEKKQIIQEETCRTIPKCVIPCVCTQSNTLISLVCDDSDRKYSVGKFLIPGCCKCVNS